jgi:ferric-dicitrate binding protein FerR (iron transport regulator)
MVVSSLGDCVPPKSRSLRPLAETVAVLFVALAGWCLLEPRCVRLVPSRVTTYDHGARAVVGDALIDIGPHSNLDIRGEGQSASVSISYGDASFAVLASARPRLAPFKVDSAELTVTATDARFSVSSWRDRPRVGVDRGVVEIEAYGTRISLSAGQRWPAASN